MKHQRLVAKDEKLIEGEAGRGRDVGNEGRQAVDAVGDLSDLGLHDISPLRLSWPSKIDWPFLSQIGIVFLRGSISPRITAPGSAASAAPRRLDRGDVYLLHTHHRIKGALCFITASR